MPAKKTSEPKPETRPADRRKLQALQRRCERLEEELANARDRAANFRLAEKGLWKLVVAGYDGVAIHTDRRLVYISPGGLRRLGFRNRKQVLGRSFLEFLHPDHHAAVLQSLKRSEDTGNAFGPIEVRIPRRDGQFLDVEVLSVPLIYDGKPSHINLFKDLTARKRADRIIGLQRDLAVQLGAASDLAAGAALCLDAAMAASGMDCGGVYVRDDSSGVLRMVAHRNLGQAFAEHVAVVGPDSPKNRLVMEGKPFYSEYPNACFGAGRVERKEGLRAIAVIPFAHEGRIIGCTNIGSHTRPEVPAFARNALETMAAQVGNAIARLKAEAAIWEREAAYRTLAENVPGIVYRMPLRESRPTQFFNEMLTLLTGHTPDTLRPGTGSPLESLIVPEDRDRVAQEIRQALADGRPFSVEYRLRHRDGSLRHLSERGRPVLRDGKVLHIDGVIVDMTEHVRTAEDRQRTETHLLQAQKLESLGALAGGIAHDFNNILMSILGHVELALPGGQPGSPVHDSLAEIDKAARRAADLCRQMLAYAGRSRFEMTPLDLNDVVRDMARMVEVSSSKWAIVRYKLADGLPLVVADAAQIRQALMNLIINASEAIGERSGVIAISTGIRECDRACLAAGQPGDERPEGLYVYIEVADTGCGMAPETVSRIFDPFFTTKFAGRGLGLAAVLGIVRGHKGFVQVESEPGRGATFRVFFPAAPEGLQTADSEPSESDAWRGSGTVLLVDDEENVRVIVRKMLERLGFLVLLAANGREAVQVFREESARIRCVLLDLTMPHMDGEATLQELRKIRPDVPVILASGYDEREMAQRFAGKGAVGFLHKPFDLRTLVQRLQEIKGFGTSPSAG